MHVAYPIGFLPEVALLASIKAKVDADGAASPLIALFLEQGIDLTEDTTAANLAVTQNNSYLVASKLAEKLGKERDLLIKPVMKHIRGEFQFLKSLYSPFVKNISLWGGSITNSGKIIYPKNIYAQVDLLKDIKTQHDSYTTPASPLSIYLTQHTISLVIDTTNGANAVIKDTDALAAMRSSENFRELRDKGWSRPLKNIHAIVNFLRKLYVENAKTLGDYGIVVVDGIHLAKEKTIIIEEGGNRVNIITKIGSTVRNDSDFAIHIYKGKKILGKYLTLLPGELFLVAKGYSALSVENTSKLKKATITLIPE